MSNELSTNEETVNTNFSVIFLMQLELLCCDLALKSYLINFKVYQTLKESSKHAVAIPVTSITV